MDLFGCQDARNTVFYLIKRQQPGPEIKYVEIVTKYRASGAKIHFIAATQIVMENDY